MQTTLRIIAGVLAGASLLGTIFFVHDRRQRLPGILLSTGLIFSIVGPLFHNTAIEIALGVISTVLVVASGALYVRVLRARAD